MSRHTKTNAAPIDWLAVGRRIRELRGFDLTQKEFADSVGVSQSYLSSMESGSAEIGAAILLRISQTYGRSIEWLLTGHFLSKAIPRKDS
jgi:transcriptional regulator with XRE-family HTH domain